MNAASRTGIAPFGWSLALHAVIAGLLYLGLRLPDSAETPPLVLPIDAVLMDQAVIQAASRQRSADERRQAEVQRREEAAAEARRAELLQNEQQEVVRRNEEQQRVAAEQKARADAEAKRKAETEAKQKTEQQAAAKAAAEKKRAAEDARLRQEREADLRARLAAEEERTSAGFQSLKARYVLAIQAHVEQRWFEPPGTGPGLSCTVHVMQIPGGEVVGTRFGRCNGNAAVRESIETAVRNASPLPAPPEPSLFEREVELIFTPKESRR
ncbi:MAG: cell envelope integrity protein TolA [Steroidobacteraceae bacterium]